MSPRVSAIRYPLLLLVYCLFNLLFFILQQPYLPAGEGVLVNGDFAQGLDGWQAVGSGSTLSQAGGVLTIDHPVADSTSLAQCWRKSALPQPLLLSAEARSEGVVRGAKSWHEARIDLVGYDAAGRGQYQVPTRLLNLQGDHSWQTAQALFHLLPDAQRVCLEISLYHAPGRFQVRRLSLTRGVESTLYRIGRLSLLAGWALLTIFLLRTLYRHYGDHTLGRWLLLSAGVVLVGILLPHGLRQQLEEVILHGLSAIGLSMGSEHSPGVENVWSLWPAKWDLSKLAHLLGFALLGLLLAADRSISWMTGFRALLLLALASEILQFFVPLRTPRLSDLVVDALGITIGMGLGWIVVRLRQRQK
jgi:hypothetical protein